jgi:citrate synthase
MRDRNFRGQAARLLSQVRTIAAFAYRKSRGLPAIYPKPEVQVHGELPAHDVLEPYEDMT